MYIKNSKKWILPTYFFINLYLVKPLITIVCPPPPHTHTPKNVKRESGLRTNNISYSSVTTLLSSTISPSPLFPRTLQELQQSGLWEPLLRLQPKTIIVTGRF